MAATRIGLTSFRFIQRAPSMAGSFTRSWPIDILGMAGLHCHPSILIHQNHSSYADRAASDSASFDSPGHRNDQYPGASRASFVELPEQQGRCASTYGV